MRRPDADLEEKREPRVASSAGARKGASMKSSGRGLTLAAIEKGPSPERATTTGCADCGRAAPRGREANFDPNHTFGSLMIQLHGACRLAPARVEDRPSSKRSK